MLLLAKMAGEGGPPPRVLNVQRFADARAAELQSLHAVVAERVGSDFRVPRRTRRRTSSFLNRRNSNCRTKSKKRKRQVGQVFGEDGSKTDPEVAKERKIQNRRVRRRMEFKGNPSSGFGFSGDGTKRLRTHVWHAKRFEMVKRWGFYLPLGLSGRGRGSRSILKQLKSECFIHDASYFSAVQLQGSEESVLTVLDEVLVPPPSSMPEESFKPILYGASYGQSMLYHAGADSQAIAPVTYMWQPLVRTSTHTGVDSGASDGHYFLCEKKQRQLWIWLHAASFKEGFDVLRAACGRQMHANSVSVNCVSREGELGRLDLFGSNSFKICQKLLKPMPEAYDNARCSKLVNPYVGEEGINSTILSESFDLEHAEHLPFHAILSLSVLDPRLLPIKESKCPFMGPKTEPIAQDGSSEENNVLGWEATADNIESFVGTWFEHERNCLVPNSKELWELSTNTLISPMEESLLCAEKHQRRLSFFFMDNKNQEMYTTKSTNSFSRFCPILLLRNSQKDISCLCGWSIILPVSWIKAFWISMVSHGGHAIGLRERRWIACEAKVPSFPYDFPDCKAYADHMASEAVAFDKKTEALPPSRRLMRIQIPPPWNCITLPRKGGLLTQSNEVSPCLLTGVNDGLHDDLAFQGFVARTSVSLLKHLKDIHVDQCPEIASKDSCAELANKTGPNWTTSGANSRPISQKCCFVRTVLYANRRGVFEEGASVCAPTSDDYSLWSSRPNEQELPQISLTLLRSSFTPQCFDKWQMHVPEDPNTRQFHRQLIGFVTTGFVRGSVKAAAEALCEASMLAQLSKEQPAQNGKGKNQIMVLIRNPRSSAYRPGHATIVLQQQDDDHLFM